MTKTAKWDLRRRIAASKLSRALTSDATSQAAAASLRQHLGRALAESVCDGSSRGLEAWLQARATKGAASAVDTALPEPLLRASAPCDCQLLDLLSRSATSE